MIKRLRIKFVCVIMAITVVLLGIILGVVIHFAGENIRMQSIGMMRTIADSPFQPGGLEMGTDEDRLPFFTVKLSGRGELISAGGHVDLSHRAQLQELVDAALASGRESGKLAEYGLRYLRHTTPGGITLVFGDTAAEEEALRGLIAGCLGIFALALVVFLGVSIGLSNWVIRPVEKAWDQQRQFVDDASHELKTPLSVIMANAELLQSRDTGSEDREKFAGNILATTYQMRGLVENMLEMARVDNGTVNMTFADLDMSQLVEDAVLSFRLLYEEQTLGLDSRIDGDIRIQGSERHLYQVMDVLLDNALKYSAPGGTVHVALSRSGRGCLLQVASPGEPLSPEEGKAIFERFYRADKARAMNGSYGLGLSIAESIVTAHKGKIWVRSGEGCNTFFVQLPNAPGNHRS